MELPTVEIPKPELPAVLPTDHQELMNLFYNHWQALSAKVRENNAALSEGCCDVFVNPNVEGMLRSPTQAEIAAVMPAKVNAAVILGNHNSQVQNGGWDQWDGNGYSESVMALRDLYQGAVRAEVEDADKVLALIDEFLKDKENAGSFCPWGDDDDDQQDGPLYDHLDRRFYALETERIMQAILDRFDAVTRPSFMAGAYCKAA